MMSKTTKRLCFFLVAAAGVCHLASCNESENEPERSFSVTTKELQFTDAAAAKYIDIKSSNVVWTASCEDSWITVISSAEESRICVAVSANETESERTGTVTVKCEGYNSVDVPVKQSGKGTEYYLTVEPSDAIKLDYSGGSAVLQVDSNADWEVSVSADWISYQRTDNTVTVEVGGYSEAEDRAGEITFSAEGVADVAISVTQSGYVDPEPSNIWERSILSRMNYRGKVKSSTLHVSVIEESNLLDLNFNEQGMLTSFGREKLDNTRQSFTVEYDASGRISKLILKSDKDDAYVEFGYGSHGVYIPTEQIFYDISYTINSTNMIWLPQFIKDLSSVKLVDNLSSRNNIDFTYTISGNSGTLRAVFGNDESKAQDTYHTLTIKDGYVNKVEFYFYYANTVDEYTFYPDSGAIQEHKSSDGDYGDVFYIRSHNNDRANTLKSIDSWGELIVYGYNEYLDLISGGEDNFTYEYDTADNWTAMSQSGEKLYDRTIIYY